MATLSPQQYKKVFRLLCAFSMVCLKISCSTYTNVQSDHRQATWNSFFKEFNGTEKLKFDASDRQLVYLSYALQARKGSLKIFANGTELPNVNPVNHKAFEITRPLRLKIKGKHAEGYFKLKYPSFYQKKVNINFNRNIELLALSYFLINYDDFSSITDEQSFTIDGKQVKVKDLYAMNLQIANEFKPFLKSENLKIIKSFFDHTFYLQFSNFFISLNDFPHAKMPDGPYPDYFSSRADAEKLVMAFNRLHGELQFDRFLLKYKPYYDEMTSEVAQHIPPENFIPEMEHFYNKSVAGYYLYPSLTMPFSQGFGVGAENRIGNVFGSLRPAEEIHNLERLNVGFNDSAALRTVCIHEFGHSFVNPAIDRVGDKVIGDQEKLYRPIKEKMEQQGYNTWKISLYEHFVRAGEVIITRHLKDDKKATEILNDQVNNRSFIYLPQIIDALEYWYDNEYPNKSYNEKVIEIIKQLR